MNITSHTVSTPIPTVVNPPTDALRRENNQREIIAKPAAAQQSTADKGVGSERDKAKTPAQNNEQIDFENLRKQAELANSTISDEEHDSSKGEEQSHQPFSENAKNSQTADNADNSEDIEPTGKDNQQVANEEAAEEKVISELQSRDKEVRAHEAAHASVGGSTTGAPSYSFETGPDGKRYAVDGEVSVDLSTVAGNPQATISKMQRVYAAALAPAQPSAQDLRVANSATKKILQAQSELTGLNAASRTADAEGRSTLSGVENDQDDALQNNEYDQAMAKTLKAQEQVAPERPVDIDKRALHIENHYSKITQAFEKPPSYQFELTA